MKSPESEKDQLSYSPPPFYRRGMFWMLVGVVMASAGALWLVSERATYALGHKPAGFYLAIAGFAVYVAGRITQVVQRSRKKKNT